MPRKRVASKRRQSGGILADPFGWLVFWLGWVGNLTHEPEPPFKTMDEMRKFYLANRERVLESVSEDSWAWHAFEDHDRATCEYCNQAHMERQLAAIGTGESDYAERMQTIADCRISKAARAVD